MKRTIKAPALVFATSLAFALIVDGCADRQVDEGSPPQGRTPIAGEGNGKFDTDSDGLIEISNLEQLAAIGYDIDGDGLPDLDNGKREYYEAFPVEDGEEVCGVCNGYELTRSLDFSDAGSYASGRVNAEWRTGAGWKPPDLGSYQSSTTFDGNGFTISNLYVDDTSHQLVAEQYNLTFGLFAEVHDGSVIRAVGLLDVDVTGPAHVGGLVGRNYGVISDAYVTGKVSGANNVGGMAGTNRGSVMRSYTAATVSGEVAIGGLVGRNHGDWDKDGAVVSSHATGDVSGNREVGGLIGRNEEGDVRFSYATGNVSGGSSVGGLVGVNLASFYPSTITASYAEGKVSGDSVVGGLTGGNSGAVTASYASGDVFGSSKVGGLIGDNSMPWASRWDEGGVGTVIASYASGGVSGRSAVGGVAGDNPGRIISTFWDKWKAAHVTGVGKGHGADAQGRTTIELQSPMGFTGTYGVWNIDLDNADGDFTMSTGAGDFWDFGTSDQYPALKADIDGDGQATWQEFGRQGRDQAPVTATAAPTETVMPTPVPAISVASSAGFDTDSDGLIEVSNLEQLNAIRYDLDGDGRPDASGSQIYALAFPSGSANAVCGGCTGYELARSLDFQDPDSYASGAIDPAWSTGSGWLPIGTAANEELFDATFDGNGHTITNLYVSRTTVLDDPGAVGLFGNTGSSAVIRGVGLVDAVVTGVEQVGSLVGYNRGTINGSYATGSVSGKGVVGGLVGWNTGAIAFSHTAAVTHGGHNTGGLIGLNDGTVKASYADGITSGLDYVGGLIGNHGGPVTDSYATGRVSGKEYVGGLVGSSGGLIETSYANVDVSGEEHVGGLIGNNGYDVFASYATGIVAGERYVGGLVGRSASGMASTAIVACYATGRVTGKELVGGLVGENYGAVIASFWDTQSSGQPVGAGMNESERRYDISRGRWADLTQLYGKTTRQLQEPTDYTGIFLDWNPDGDHPIPEWDRNWDGEARDYGTIWDFGTSSQYPALKVDFDGDGRVSWEEFGAQIRNRP